MLLYIEKEFAIAFEKEMLAIDPFEKPTEDNAARRLFELFKSFPELEIYSDVEQEEKNQIRLFRYLLNLNPVIRNIDQFTFELSKTSSSLHLLAFTAKRHVWAEQFEDRGGLYFTLADYLSKISKILEFEKTIRFKDLKKPFTWNDIAYISKLTAERALVTDNYLISNKNKRDKNLKPLLRILSKINSADFIFELFVDEFKLGWNKENWRDFEQEIEDFKDNEDLDIDVKIKRYSSKNGNTRYDFHDRKLFLRYLKVEVGKGFDLLPYDDTTINDKKVVVGTIFSKDTYDDFRSYLKVLYLLTFLLVSCI
jgi:hypothetical protein